MTFRMDKINMPKMYFSVREITSNFERDNYWKHLFWWKLNFIKKKADITGQIYLIVAISVRPRWWKYEITSYSDEVLLRKRYQI